MEEGGSKRDMNEEVELSLDLSIGTKTYAKSKHILRTTSTSSPKILTTEEEQLQLQLQLEDTTTKREVQAMRWQEARKRINNLNIIAASGGEGRGLYKGNNDAVNMEEQEDNDNNKNAKLDASSGGSSSVLSDHHNSSIQGDGSSSDTGSSASKFCQEKPNAMRAGDQLDAKSQNISGFNGMKSNKVEEKAVTNQFVNKVSLGMHQSHEANCSEEPKSNTQQADRRSQPNKSTQGLNAPFQLKEDASYGVIGKTPIPKPESHNTSSLPQMPCVSTTGNGPNGKTITGFLYRYTKTEVSIVCVCHGTSFSPAEFVEHAGGVDVTHPLRHITVIPSAFA